MNILILTPDRVGSTLLQCAMTTYMTSSGFDKPVINLTELTDTIIKYHSDEFNMEVLGKPLNGVREYSLSFPEVTDLLKSANHHIVTRLAHYHLKKRKDSLIDQTNFFKYLNENFFIISCRRSSVFEYALSWGITAGGARKNIYNHREKIKSSSELFKNKLSIPSESFKKYLSMYKDYIEWVDTYFDVNSFFTYEDNISSLETYIQNLDCFANTKIKSWDSMFGMSWDDWNKCHRILGDVNYLDLDTTKMIGEPTSTITDIVDNLPMVEKEFLNAHAMDYLKSADYIKKLVDTHVLARGIPIKGHLLIEKKMIIKNFNECALIYNEWAGENGYPIIKDSDEIINQAREELKIWYEEIPNNLFLR